MYVWHEFGQTRFSVLDAKANEGHRDRHILKPLVRVQRKEDPKMDTSNEN